jgi:hypothetical protein
LLGVMLNECGCEFKMAVAVSGRHGRESSLRASVPPSVPEKLIIDNLFLGITLTPATDFDPLEQRARLIKRLGKAINLLSEGSSDIRTQFKSQSSATILAPRSASEITQEPRSNDFFFSPHFFVFPEDSYRSKPDGESCFFFNYLFHLGNFRPTEERFVFLNCLNNILPQMGGRGGRTRPPLWPQLDAVLGASHSMASTRTPVASILRV